MLFLPFVGLFVGLSLWGSFFPIPGFSSPDESFIKRITGSMHLTIIAKGIHGMAEVITSGYGPGHSANGPYLQYMDFADPFMIINGTSPIASSLDARLLDETFLIRTSTVPQKSLAACVTVSDGTVPAERGREYSEKVSTSSESSVCSTFVAGAGALVFATALWFAYILADEARIVKFLRFLDLVLPGDGANRLHIGNGLSLYEEMDFLVVEGKLPWTTLRVNSDTRAESSTSSDDYGWIREVSILRQVEKTISRLERQRALSIVCEELARILRVLEAKSSGGSETAPDASDAAADLRDARQRALVVRRPENLAPVMVFQLVCALCTSWERNIASAVPVSSEDPVQAAEDQNQFEAEDVDAPKKGRRKRKRPSKAKRMRDRRQREEQEQGQLVPGPVPPQRAQHSGPAAFASQPYGPGYGYASGPPPTPTPAVMAFPSPFGPQYMPYGPGYYYGHH